MASRISLLWVLTLIAERILQQKALYVLVIVFSLNGFDSCRPENPLIIGTTKSCVGHAKTMSGLIGVIKTLSSFTAGTVPSLVQLWLDNMNPSIDCSIVPLHIPFKTAELKKSVCDDFVSENWSICLIFFLTSLCTDQIASPRFAFSFSSTPSALGWKVSASMPMWPCRPGPQPGRNCGSWYVRFSCRRICFCL